MNSFASSGVDIFRFVLEFDNAAIEADIGLGGLLHMFRVAHDYLSDVQRRYC
jgi:hypothetical protein